MTTRSAARASRAITSRGKLKLARHSAGSTVMPATSRKRSPRAVEFGTDPLQALLGLLNLDMRKSCALAARHPAGDADQNRAELVSEIGREPYPRIGAGIPVHMDHDT